MRFITETELRDLYKVEPFTAYVLEAQTKITPEARQFLVDRGIKITQTQENKSKSAGTSKNNIDTSAEGKHKSRGNLKLIRRMESLEALFLLVGANLLREGDSALAEEVFGLGRCFSQVKKSAWEPTSLSNVNFQKWSEAELGGCSAYLGKHFDINEFHVGTEIGVAVAALNHLRASLHELEAEILEIYWQEGQRDCSREDLIDNINLIVNILCVMMWKCLGGQKCKL